MLNGTNVELPAMLARREQRAAEQAAFLKQYHQPLLSFCLNIPGPVKTTPALQQVFDEALQEILLQLQAAHISILEQKECRDITGDECLLVLQGDAAKIKQLMTTIEETHPLGRLFDLDVLDTNGQKLSRPLPRRCLLCSAQAQLCARSRKHSVAELTDRIEEMVLAYHAKKLE